MKICIKCKSIYEICLCMLIFVNICLYDLSTIGAYILSSTLVIGVTLCTSLYQGIAKNDTCFIWLIFNYVIFVFNGVIRLKYGDYNWDFQIFNFASNICIYLCLKGIFKELEWKKSLLKSIVISSIGTVFYMLYKEVENLNQVGVRLGDSLSGNVNTVGECLGILSLMLAFLYCVEKRKICLVIFILVSGVMLLTGSKMTFICLAMDLVIFMVLYSKGYKKWFVLGIIGCVTLYVIFNVPLFYEVIGSRIEDMIYQMFGIGRGSASNSTSDRMGMITEGFKIFLNHPIFGGGEKYYAAMSPKYGHYGYSHCNYTEMLCNFGLVGTSIYYVPVLYNMYLMNMYKKTNELLAVFGIIFLVARLILDWTAVTHSDICINYIPMIISFVIVNRLREEYMHQNVKIKDL